MEILYKLHILWSKLFYYIKFYYLIILPALVIGYILVVALEYLFSWWLSLAIVIIFAYFLFRYWIKKTKNKRT